MSTALSEVQDPFNPALAQRVSQQLSSADRLRSLIVKRLAEKNLSLRWVERRYVLGHGTIGNLLRGKSRLSLDHLDLFADLFEIAPAKLFAEAYEDSPHPKHTIPLPSHKRTAAPGHGR